jgi:hypothetical protein
VLFRSPEALPEDILRAVRFAVWMDRKAEAARFCDSYAIYFGLPRDVGSLELMAHVYADIGQKIQAADVWAAIYRAETDETFRRRALRSVAALDSTEVAIRLHEEQLARSPDDSDARLRLARLYQIHGMRTPYLGQLEELLRRDPTRDELRAELAWGCAAAREYDRLLPHLDALRLRGKETPELRELYLEALVETGKPGKDIGALTLAAERAFGERRRERCLELIREAAAHPQASEAAVFRCVQLGLWLNSASDAARFCDVLVARFGLPKDLERLKFVAQVYGDRGEKVKAAELWAMAYRLEPDEAGRRKDMLAAIALDPGPRAIDLSADYLSRNADDDAVRETYARLLQIGRAHV